MVKKRSCLTRLLCRYACLENPHLRQVNCGFRVCASLKLARVIQLQGKEVVLQKLVGQPQVKS